MKSQTARRAEPNALSAKANFAVNTLFWMYSILCIIPTLIVLAVSFSSEKQVIRDGYSLIPRGFTTRAYEVLFQGGDQILRSYGVTIWVTVAGTALGVLIMALFAYPLSRRDFPHRSFFSFVVFVPMLFSGGIVPFYIIYTKYLGLKDSLWALIIPGLLNAFYVIVIRTFFQNTIPSELYESARIDGAGEFRTFAAIVLPLSLPVLATVGLFSTLGYWNEWFLSLIFIDSPDKVSLQYLMYKTILNIQYLTQHGSYIGDNVELPSETARMAMAVVGMGPIVLTYPFFQKYFVKGLTVGAVKG